MITSEQVKIVQSTWTSVEEISDVAANLFYQKLFELDPTLRTLFPDEMAEQKKKLMQTLAVCVNGLSDIGEIVPAVRALGQRHAGYQVNDEHYETVGAALLWTLEQGLGDGVWNNDTSNAWLAVYTVLSDTMKSAAAELSCTT